MSYTRGSGKKLLVLAQATESLSSEQGARCLLFGVLAKPARWFHCDWLSLAELPSYQRPCTRRGLPHCEVCPRRPHYKPSMPPPPPSYTSRQWQEGVAKEYNLSSHIVPICQCLVKRQPPISDGEVEL